MYPELHAVYAGWPKCGSTWFHRFCEASPELAVSEAKDLRYFTTNFSKGKDWLYGQLNFPDATARPVEIYHDYVFSEEALVRISQASAEVKIIVFLRHPIDWLMSEYDYVTAIGGVTCDFSEYLKKYDYAISYCQYSDHLDRIFSYFPRERVFVGLLENLAENPEGFANNLCSFLEVSPDFFNVFDVDKKVNERMAPRMSFIPYLTRLTRSCFLMLGLDSFYGKVKRGPVRKILFKNRNDRKEIPLDALGELVLMSRKIRNDLEKTMDIDFTCWEVKDENFEKMIVE